MTRREPSAETWAPRLLFVTDSLARGFDTTVAVTRLLCTSCKAASVAVLLREPGLPARALAEQARVLRELTAGAGQTLLLRDRLDVALWVNADGVHLGEQSVMARELLPIVDALRTRRTAGTPLPPFVLTRAWHALDSVPDPDATALVVSPVCAARKGLAALGRDGLRRALRVAEGRPVYALGGVDTATIPWILEEGAAGIAAIGAVYDTPTQLIDELKLARS